MEHLYSAIEIIESGDTEALVAAQVETRPRLQPGWWKSRPTQNHLKHSLLANDADRGAIVGRRRLLGVRYRRYVAGMQTLNCRK